MTYPATGEHPDPAQLANLPLFGALCDEGLERFAALAEKRFVPATEDVFVEGDLGQEIYVISSGSVGVYRTRDGEEHRLAELKAGDFFGEMAFIDMQPRAGTVRADVDTILWVWSFAALRTTYKSDMKTYMMLVMNVAREISRRLRRADDSIMLLCTRH